MTPVLKKYKAAAVNAEPGWFDLEESVRRTIHWINEAGQQIDLAEDGGEGPGLWAVDDDGYRQRFATEPTYDI